MTFNTLSEFSYWLVALGTLLEGEVSLALAGVAAERGLMHIAWVIAAAFAGAFAGDQTTFIVLRWFGSRVFERFPALAARTSRVRGVLARRAVPAIFVTRFLWGLRTPAYATLASSDIPYPVFLMVNVVACAAWATVVGTLAFAFSHSVATIIARMADVQKMGLAAAALLVAAALAIMGLRWLLGRHKAAHQG